MEAGKPSIVARDHITGNSRVLSTCAKTRHARAALPQAALCLRSHQK